MVTIVTCLLSITASEKVLSDGAQLAAKGDAAFEAGFASEALEYYTEALDNAEQTKDDFLCIRCLGKIGNVYSFTNDEKRAISYFLDGYDAAEKMGDQTLQYNFASALVGEYCRIGDVEKAKLFFQTQRRLVHEQMDLKQFYLLYNQGRIAKAEDKYKMAAFYMQKAADFARERKMEPNIIYAPYMMLMEMSLERKKYDEAQSYIDRAEVYARKSNGQYPLSSVYRARASYYEARNMPDSAERYGRLYHALEDSMFNRAQFYVAHNKLFDYENSVNKRKISRLVSKNNFLTVGIIAAVLLLAVISVLLVMLRKRNAKLKDAYSSLLDKIQEQIKSDDAGKNESTESDSQHKLVGYEASSAKNENNERGGLNLDEENYRALRHRITNALANPEILNDPNLTLVSLADKIGSNSTYVSHTINRVYSKSFRQVVNELRIREACRRMSDTENYGNLTLQSIYEGVGFNSAASFIQAFKKENGMTPSTYQKMIRSRVTDRRDTAENSEKA